MNKPITLKITLALFFVIICQSTLRAQDTTKKMILVVRPGQANTPASTNPVNSATPGQATTVFVPDNKVPMPVRTAPMDHPIVKMTSLPNKPSTADDGKKGTGINPNIPTNVAATVSPAMAPPVKVSPSINLGGGSGSANSAASKPAVTPIKTNAAGYTAPTTAERSVSPSLVPRKATPPIMVPVKPSELAAMNANKAKAAANGGASGPATTAVVVTPVVVPVIAAPKKDTVAVVTKKDSLIAKKDTAKKDSLLAKADTSKKDTSNTDTIGFQKQRIVFAEIGGPGLAISANYDMRVTIGQNNRFGFRIGAGYFKSGNNYVFTIPFQANYLYGNDGKYLEFGLGTTFLKSDGDNYSSKNFIFDKITGLIATGTIGIRYAPANSHVNFRLAYVPIIDDDGLVNIGGFSVGYTF